MDPAPPVKAAHAVIALRLGFRLDGAEIDHRARHRGTAWIGIHILAIIPASG
jgi:hypothetical protein